LFNTHRHLFHSFAASMNVALRAASRSVAAPRAALRTLSTTAAPRAAAADSQGQPMPAARASEEQHLDPANIRRVRNTRAGSDVPVGNIEAQWARLTPDEQASVYGKLEELQKRDWKTLSLDEKKAGACAGGRVRADAPLTRVGSVVRRLWPARPSRAHQPARDDHENHVWSDCHYCRVWGALPGCALYGWVRLLST
jgi:hypothetical protein